MERWGTVGTEGKSLEYQGFLDTKDYKLPQGLLDIKDFWVNTHSEIPREYWIPRIFCVNKGF